MIDRGPGKRLGNESVEIRGLTWGRREATLDKLFGENGGTQMNHYRKGTKAIKTRWGWSGSDQMVTKRTRRQFSSREVFPSEYSAYGSRHLIVGTEGKEDKSDCCLTFIIIGTFREKDWRPSCASIYLKNYSCFCFVREKRNLSDRQEMHL